MGGIRAQPAPDVAQRISKVREDHPDLCQRQVERQIKRKVKLSHFLIEVAAGSQ